MLSYDNATQKFVNTTFNGQFALPLRAPNNANFWGNGATQIPYQLKDNVNGWGLGLRAGGGAIVIYINGQEFWACDGTFFGSGNGFQMALRTDSSLNSPIFVVGTTNACVYASNNAQGIAAKRWNWGEKAVANWGWIDSTSLSTSTRLDIKSTLIDDYRMRINNLFNLFSFQNSAGTVTYLTIDVANNRVRMPNRFYSEINILEGAASTDTTININNNYFNVNFAAGGNLTISNNAGSTGNLSYTANTNEFQINNANGVTVEISCSFSMLLDQNISIFDVTLWNMNENIEIPKFHRRHRGNANEYLNYSAIGSFTPNLTNQRIAIKIKANQNQPIIASITNMTISVQDLML